jgi:hypothetical protein
VAPHNRSCRCGEQNILASAGNRTRSYPVASHCINIQHDTATELQQSGFKRFETFLSVCISPFSLCKRLQKIAHQYGYKGGRVDLVKYGEQVSRTRKCRLLLNEQNEVVTEETFPK